MNPEPDNERLLSDVLSEATPADFREALLGRTLQRVRRRRRWRQTRRVAAGLAALGLVAVLVWRSVPRPTLAPRLAESASDGSYRLVRTQPLPAGAVVATRPLAAGQLVASIPTASVLETRPGSGNFHVIGDDELLALVAPRPAALVRLGPNSELLVFANPEDEKGFPVN